MQMDNCCSKRDELRVLPAVKYNGILAEAHIQSGSRFIRLWSIRRRSIRRPVKSPSGQFVARSIRRSDVINKMACSN